MKNPFIIAALVLVVILGWWIYFGRINPEKIIQRSTETIICPVNGTEIDTEKPHSLIVHEGKAYYFCSEGCLDEFEKDPEKYIK